MSNKRGLCSGVLLLIFSVVGCSSVARQYAEIEPLADTPRRVELDNTPFYAQTANHCGPAALAILLAASGVDDADPEALATQLYVPQLRGSLQTELFGAARRADRVPYQLEPTFADMLSEISAGHPVLVLQNLGLSRWPQWHYAVVIGFDIDAHDVILRSGTSRRKIMSFQRFERSWELADYWAMVTPKPGELPATASAKRYVEAVAVLEDQRRWQAANQGYEAARQRWPDYPMSYLGLGNIAYQQAEFERAEIYYRVATVVAPDEPGAYYNLAWVYMRQKRAAEAREAALQAQALAPDSARYGRAVEQIDEAMKLAR